MSQWAEQYIGIPFRPGCSDRSGVDCYGLLRLVYREMLNLNLPDYGAEHHDAAEIAGFIDTECPEWTEVPADQANAMDAVLVHLFGYDCHCGLLLDGNRMLHAWACSDSCIAQLDAQPWLVRRKRFFRHQDLIPELVNVYYRASPFRPDCEMFHASEGASLQSLISFTGLPEYVHPYIRVCLDDSPVPSRAWPLVRPKAGHTVTIMLVPGFGGGQNASIIPQDTLRLALTLGVTAGSLLIPGAIGISGVTASALQIGVSLTGTLAINALVPPPATPIEEQGYSITGTRNRLEPYGIVPKIYGQMRIWPPLAANAYTEIVGNDQYLVMLFAVGYGPLSISDIRIGDTPVRDFQDVQIEVFNGADQADPSLNLYGLRDIYENENMPADPLQQAETFETLGVQDENVIQRTTADDTDRIQVDFTFPQGLIYQRDNGAAPWRVILHVQFRLEGTTRWYDAPIISETELRDEAGNADKPTFFGWLEDLRDQLQAINDDLEFVAGDNRTMPGALLAYYIRWIERILNFLDTTTEDDSGNQTILDTLRTQISRFQDILGTFIEDAVDAAIEEYIDDLTALHPLIGEILELNSYLNQGYGPDTALLTPLQRFLIMQQGIESIFGEPDPGEFQVLGMRGGILRRSYEIPVPRGKYEVRVRRDSPTNENNSSIRDDVRWTSLRSVRIQSPVTMPNLAKVALRIRASGQLSGSIDQLNCLAQAKLSVWDGVDDTQAVDDWGMSETRNPAWAYIDQLTGPQVAAPVDVSRLDLSSLKTWADWCDTEELKYDFVMRSDTTIFESLKQVASAGRASFAMRDGKYSVIIDKAQSTPVQLFTPRNSFNFQGEKIFAEVPHAAKVRYVDPEEGWQVNELTVYRDGYSETGGEPDTVVATKFESVDLSGITDTPDEDSEYHTGLAWKHGRMMLATAQLRPEVFTFQTDLEHLVCRRGDRIRHQEEVSLTGQKSARIVSVTTSGNDLVSFTIDDTVTVEESTSYAVQIRKSDGVFLDRAVSFVGGAGEYSEITLAGPTDMGATPVGPGDLVSFGETDLVTRDLLIKEIRAGEDLAATLICVEYNSAIYDADTGPIPEYDARISVPPPDHRPAPMAPVIRELISDETVLKRDTDGALQSRILILVGSPSQTTTERVSHLQAQFRPTGTTDSVRDASLRELGSIEWVDAAQYSDNPEQIYVGPVQDEEHYDVRVRYVTPGGLVSPWTTATDHEVIGKSTPPPSIDGLYRENTYMRWIYDRAPLDLWGFIIKTVAGLNSNWERATKAHQGVVTDTRFDISQMLNSGERTILVKAIDVAGNESLRTASLIVNLGDPLPENIVKEQDHYALTWPGTRTNASVASSTGYLEADFGADQFWQNDNALFWENDSELFWGQDYEPLQYDVVFTPESQYLPATLLLEFDVEATVYEVLYRKETNVDLWPEDMEEEIWPEDMNDPYWPSGVLFQAWPGSLEAQNEQYEFRIKADGGLTQGIVKAFKIILDVQDLIQSVQDFEVAAGGSRLTLNKDFRAIKALNLTLQTDSNHPDARYAEYIDKQNVQGDGNGPAIKVYDDTAAPRNSVSGLVDAIIIGYGP